MNKKLLAIDGNSILNRAFYGIRPLTTKDGFPTNALYGMVTMITRQAEALSPDFCAVAFDLKAPTFRHKMYDQYKAGRKPMPEELARQLPVAKELMQALGYTVLELTGYEADDLLGTLAQRCAERGYDAYLMTGDRDALQLIQPHVHVLLATNQETIDMDEAAFFGKYGVQASQFVDVKALMGDPSDHIPGVPGIGEKTALKLIADYQTLDGVYQALPTAKHTPSVRAKLEAGRDSAYLSRTLAQICCEAPIPQSIEELAFTGIRREALRNLFLRLEFSAFIKRFSLTETNSEPQREPASESVAASVRTATAEELCVTWKDATVLAIDEAEDGVFLFNGEELCFLREPLETLCPFLQSKLLICYDCKSLYKHPKLTKLRELRLYDLMLGAYLANSARSSFSIAVLVSEYLGESLSDTVPRIRYFWRLYPILRDQLEQSGQTALMEELEMPLAAVLADMEQTGFYIDRDGIAQYGEQLGTMAAILEKQINAYAGKNFNINSPKQLGEVLFEVLKLPHAKKTKTGYSTKAEILEKLRPYHPIIQDILDYRQLTKLKSTYTDGLLKVADADGRVHTTFQQTGTATGRLSSSEPNLQNIPVRTELGRELRRFFRPANEDYVIVDADYSQIELRLLAHVSKDPALIQAFLSGADIHTSTAATVFGISESEVTPEMRKKAKAVNFGILYGIGAFSLADDLGVSIAQAQAYIDQYLAGYPGIDAYLKATVRQAYENGYVTTLFGRRRYIPELSGTNKMQQKFGERVAMNSPIQGTAADIIKLAMIRVHRRLAESGMQARLILQVHDELILEAHRDCAEQALQLLKEEMETVVSYAVPLDAEAHIGNTWYEAK